MASGECDRGIVVCTTGIGISIAANKVKGIRCALCSEPLSAEMTRRHNDANMLAMGGGMIGNNMADRILDAFLNTEFEGAATSAGWTKSRADTNPQKTAAACTHANRCYSFASMASTSRDRASGSPRQGGQV